MYNCEKCNYSTTFKQRYQVHLLSKKHVEDEHIIKSYECKKCNYSTVYKHCYDSHLLSKKHTDEKKIRECKCCRFKCKTLQQFDRHYETKKHKTLYSNYPLIKRLEKIPINELDNKQKEMLEKFYEY